jgi:hypothetical protein
MIFISIYIVISGDTKINFYKNYKEYLYLYFDALLINSLNFLV